MAEAGIERAGASRAVLVRVLVVQGILFVVVLWAWRYVGFSGWWFARWVSPLAVGNTPLTMAGLVAVGSFVSARGASVGAAWLPTLLTVTTVGVVLSTVLQLLMGIQCGPCSGVVLLLPMLACCAGSIWVWHHVRSSPSPSPSA
ncbi:hypothetical protein BH10ACT3_BH10ACT3_08000 [soil metagenome]